jgi:CheY-like chemotaxis protein
MPAARYAAGRHGGGCAFAGVEARPQFAVVDIHLACGDARIVAKELSGRYGTAVLFATAHCDDLAELARTGALGCLTKPYDPDDVQAALAAIGDIQAGRAPASLPDKMMALSP